MSIPSSFAFICTYESNAAADSGPMPPWLPATVVGSPTSTGFATNALSLSTSAEKFASAFCWRRTPMRSDARSMFWLK
jgi:hypothetical protein